MSHESVLPRHLSYDLLEEITNGFSKDRELGRGSYGTVYLGVNKDGEKIAVKVLYYREKIEDNDKQFEKEFRNLACLQHPNIVRLVGYWHQIHRECTLYEGKLVLAHVTKRALCFEYMRNGSLKDFISDESSGHDWPKRYAIIKGICMGLKYLHEELETPIFHLDLKPENVLLDEHMVPRIADFGLSRFLGKEHTYKTASPIGTIGYLPPEFIRQQVISNKLDIFSLGVLIITIMKGPMGFIQYADTSPQEFIDHVSVNWRNRLRATSIDGLESYYKQIKRCIEIALRCVEVDRHKRPTIGDIVNELNEIEIISQLSNALRNGGSSMNQMDETAYLFGGVVDDQTQEASVMMDDSKDGKASSHNVGCKEHAPLPGLGHRRSHLPSVGPKFDPSLFLPKPEGWPLICSPQPCFGNGYTEHRPLLGMATGPAQLAPWPRSDPMFVRPVQGPAGLSAPCFFNPLSPQYNNNMGYQQYRPQLGLNTGPSHLSPGLKLPMYPSTAATGSSEGPLVSFLPPCFTVAPMPPPKPTKGERLKQTLAKVNPLNLLQ